MEYDKNIFIPNPEFFKKNKVMEKYQQMFPNDKSKAIVFSMKYINSGNLKDFVINLIDCEKEGIEDYQEPIFRTVGVKLDYNC